MPAGALDDAGGDGEALREVLVVFQHERKSERIQSPRKTSIPDTKTVLVK
jgi:hypothetical protein